MDERERYDFLFINKISNSAKGKSIYLDYLNKYGIRGTLIDDYTSFQKSKKENLLLNFGKEKFVNGENYSLMNLKKNEGIFVFLGHEKEMTYTRAFGLDKDFIPTVAEIDMMNNSWIGNQNEVEFENIFDEKFFEPDFTAILGVKRKNAQTGNEHSSAEELRYCALQKASFMLYDFYRTNDFEFEKKMKYANFYDTQAQINEIFERLKVSAINDVKHINDLKNAKNSKFADCIVNLLEEYCVTRVDYVKQLTEIMMKGQMQGIDMTISIDDMLKMGIIASRTDSPDLPKLVSALEEKFKFGLEEKIRLENERKAQEEERIAKEKAEKEDLMNNILLDVKAKIKENNFSFKIDVVDDKNIGVVFKDDKEFKIGEFEEIQNQKNNQKTYKAINLNQSEIDSFNDFISLLKEEAQKQFSKENSNEHRTYWKQERPSYTNDFKYERNVPYALQGRKQFVAWRLEWQESGKLIKDEKGVIQYNEDGTPKMLPLFDKNGNIVYDKETGKPKLDGHWVKMPYNPTIPFNPNDLFSCRAKANSYHTWGTFKEACEYVRNNAEHDFCGIGLELGNGIIAGDIDNAFELDETGKPILDEKGNRVLKEDAREIVKIANTYTEVSPSGTGLHIVSFGHLPEGAKNKNSKKSLEFYEKARYITLTGNVLNRKLLQTDEDLHLYKMNNTVSGVQAFEKIYDEYMHEFKFNEGSYRSVDLDWNVENTLGLTVNDIVNKLLNQGERRSRLEYYYNQVEGKNIKNANYGINIMNELIVRGNWEPYFPSQSEAEFFLLSRAKFYTTSPKQLDEILRNSALMRDKWDERKSGNRTYGDLTIQEVFNHDNGDLYDPNWSPRNSQPKSVDKGEENEKKQSKAKKDLFQG